MGPAPDMGVAAPAGLDEQRRRIAGLLEAGTLWMAFQPIVDLPSGRVLGFESLARFPAEAGRSPAAWFDEAAEVGLGEALEMAAVRTALAQFDQLPEHAYMALNVSPAVASSATFLEAMDGAPTDRILVEITEHAPIEDYERLGRALAALRAHGMRLAIDDVGAGFSTMSHVLRLRPDVLKLDRSLISGIDSDRQKRALVASLVAFSGAISSAIVAEGIESPAEAEALRHLGVVCGQGYHFGRPEPLPWDEQTLLPRPRRRRLGRGHADAVPPHVAAVLDLCGDARPRRRFRRIVLNPAAAVLVVVMLAGPASAAVENAQAGDVLWRPKLGIEDLRLALSGDRASDAALHVEFASRRVGALEGINAGRGDLGTVGELSDNLTRHLVAAGRITQATSARDRAALGQAVTAVSARGATVLQALATSACAADRTPSGCEGLEVALAQSAALATLAAGPEAAGSQSVPGRGGTAGKADGEQPAPVAGGRGGGPQKPSAEPPDRSQQPGSVKPPAHGGSQPEATPGATKEPTPSQGKGPTSGDTQAPEPGGKQR